ncbi:Putative aminoacrylate hydrolase RutD [Polaromonas vacuolata]|uniref:Aminoacrylate hydrolase RutD n=1 Tax=Polaromonas vacuolata TaxID=37448 RepID=A0A6H2HDJ5_9BURK|nr:alpha/beta fold hydrolase [Polaromonas vacuolata]QJC57654.1 Putative aminoacrylate hydrolase RutD [Polaromonas vacuolata]
MDLCQEKPLPLAITAQDGYPLKGLCWRHLTDTPQTARPVIVINPATSVLCTYYSRFAAYLHRNGFDVICYDYRGIGLSKPASLRGFQAGWLDWGQLDFQAVLQYAASDFPGQPVQVVGHSVGGMLIGLAASNANITRVFSMGAQHAYWRDYPAKQRLRLLLKWHVFMPLVTALLGYFPAKRLGWMEDTPRGVVQDWTARAARFEDTYKSGARVLSSADRRGIIAQFTALRCPTLALSVTDDEFGTVAAVQRLLRCFDSSASTHLRVAPESLGLKEIGHFAFFHSRFEPTLWPIALAWLREGSLPDSVGDSVGEIVKPLKTVR